MTTPKQCYEQHLAQQDIQRDFFQAKVVDELELTYQALLARSSNFLSRFFKKEPVKGLYVWGDVGAGKTYLMDLFFECLPFKEKKRLHFHKFMREVQVSLKDLQGQKNPLILLAKRIAKKTRVICFDEFYVDDIADAMILGTLFEALFAEGVTLVATSNVPPERLYWKGLQRDRFLPAIHLIQQYTTVLHLNNHMDYRLRHLHDAGVYHWPLNEANVQQMRESFKKLAKLPLQEKVSLTLAGREVHVVHLAGNSVWFDFDVLCSVPRCQRDYLDIAAQFDTVFVSNVPVIQSEQRDLVRNFINLVDVFYDQKIHLIMSAAAPIEELYPTGPLAFEFKRTQSRLVEMRSKEYLRAPGATG